MQDGLYVALSSQIALEKRLNTIADNVANTRARSAFAPRA